MSTLHEPGINKTRKIIGYLLSILPSLMVLVSGFLKFTEEAAIFETLEKLGVAEHAVLIGGIEIFLVLLYWIPKVSNIGFFLFCSYAGGIIVGELIIGDIPVPGVTIAILVYVGTLLRKPSLSGLDI